MMKYILASVLFLLAVFSLSAQTDGQLSVTVTTVSYGGTYSPHNVVAIWVQSKTGTFVKTLLAYAATRKAYLSSWATATASTYNTVDAITGATQSSQGPRVCYWNGKNQTGTVLGDDTYNVVMEMTEGGSNKVGVFAFKKGNTAQTVTPANVSGFSNITIKWTPVSTGIQDVALDKLYSIYPNPAKNTLFVTGFDIEEVQILTLTGKYLFSTNANSIDVNRLPGGDYLVLLVTKNGNVVKRFIKN
ncbi:MAG: DUF2271 domain-containing protein [Paludibacter sp.]|nr:DUF2271 domain-containing protein [Paludibacter sp.]